MIVKAKPLKYKIMQTKVPFDEIRCLSKEERKISSQKNGESLVLFYRYIGINSNDNDYINSLKELDVYLQASEANYLKFTDGLDRFLKPNDVSSMKLIFEKYLKIENREHMNINELFDLNMGYKIKNDTLDWTKKVAFKEIMNLYDINSSNNSTARMNFGIKLLFWMNKYLEPLFDHQVSTDTINKVIFYGDIKRHEMYFLIFLSKLGCDVIYVNPKEDIDKKYPEIIGYSNLLKYSKMSISDISFPITTIKPQIKREIQVASNKVIEKNSTKQRSNKIVINRSDLIEKSYEELAFLAESVVMINVYNQNKELVGKGSGVVISSNGFIITNFHVVRNGLAFGVIFENDSNEYFIDTIVKYHTDYDLALIKVERSTKCIQLSTLDLVRGQRIISIGSPLGLFNTISEGIVSGFRELNSVEMVQITAPISPGSSGGALIDMYGHLAGITTAGYQGQNLNLTIPGKYIEQFAENILYCN